ncbi:MAG TPA: DUF6644 family protein [Bryobacteraceae bacterium]|nr:DUF6644 family protein [Bryobacteraceae bacterium]
MFLAYDPATNPLNTNEWAFPLCECFHLAALAFSIGTISMVDLRLLGAGVTERSAAQLMRDTEVWTLLGLTVVIGSGLAIFSSDPIHYLRNGAFQFKMAGLLVAMIYNYTIHRGIARGNRSAAVTVTAACVSLALWASLVFAGVFIGFI